MAHSNSNLIKGKDVIGLQVVSLTKGQIVDDVDEIVYDPKSKQVIALVVDPGGWFSSAKVIPFENINTIGSDAVVIDSTDMVKTASQVNQSITRILKGDNYLTTNKVITQDGQDLGKVSDIFFDPATGKVLEIEVSQGALKNIQSGRKHIEVGDIIKTGQDAIIVKDYVAAQLHHQAQKQGLRGAVSEAQSEAPNIAAQAKSQVQDIASDPHNQQKVGEIRSDVNQIGQTVKNKLEAGKHQLTQAAKDRALGKYLTVNILNSQDRLIASRGDMITHEILSRAETEGMLSQVLANNQNEPPLDISR